MPIDPLLTTWAQAEAQTSAVPIWPQLNACMNALAAACLVAGILAIRSERKRLHGGLMIAAGIASAVFLAGYLYYHFVWQSELGPRKFAGDGWLKKAYLGLLLTHVLGAIVNLPMVLYTFSLAARRRWTDHKRWAKRTFPLWLYVSVTGVLVYLALYHYRPG
jgi:uncharacterized membrane protein YozB (DUF420 family)